MAWKRNKYPSDVQKGNQLLERAMKLASILQTLQTGFSVIALRGVVVCEIRLSPHQVGFSSIENPERLCSVDVGLWKAAVNMRATQFPVKSAVTWTQCNVGSSGC
jgi:hypothetical protein